jgi:hypothetical protein
MIVAEQSRPHAENARDVEVQLQRDAMTKGLGEGSGVESECLIVLVSNILSMRRKQTFVGLMGVTGFLYTYIVNVGDDEANAIPTEWLVAPMVAGPSEDADDEGDGESKWKGEGGLLGGDMY